MRILQPGEGVGLYREMLTRRHSVILLIQSKVTARRLDRVGADVEIGDRLRSAPRRIEGKSAREAEGIQHIGPARQSFDPTPVFPLIQEKTRLLTTPHIRLKAQTRLLKNYHPVQSRTIENLPVTPPLVRRLRLEVAAEAQDDAFGHRRRDEQIAQHLQSGQPGRSVELHHQRPRITIHNETGPAVAFAIDESQPVRARTRHPDPSRQGLVEPRLPPRLIQCHRFSDVEDAHPQRRGRIVETHREKLILAIINHRQLSSLSFAILTADAVRVDPGMPAPHDGFSAGTQRQLQARSDRRGIGGGSH